VPDGTDQSLPEDWAWKQHRGECLKLIEDSAAGQLEDHNLGDARTIDLRA
jgi:hypothetical protein